MEKKIKYPKELNFTSDANRNFIDYIRKEKRTFDEYQVLQVERSRIGLTLAIRN